MVNDIEKIKKAGIIIKKIANGTNPINNLPIETESFLHDPRIIMCFYFVSEVLEDAANGNYNNKRITDFLITTEQKNKVVFIEGSVGVNEVSKCINMQINVLVSKKVSGMLLNKGLKKLGILTEIDQGGKKRTTTNEKSMDYGFILEKKSFKGQEFYMVVINDIGKKYSLDNIEQIMVLED